MLVSAYRKLRSRLDRIKEAYHSQEIGAVRYYFSLVGLRILTQILVLPRFLVMGPFKTFTEFARTDDQGSWIDSYNEFIIANRVTAAGIIALILIAVVTIVVFIYLPIIYI